MSNNFLGMVRKKLDAQDQVRLSASDRALLEQTCSGLEEIKLQRMQETAALTEIKDLVRDNPEVFAGECSKLQNSIEEALKKVETAQEETEKTMLLAVSEETIFIKKVQKRFSAVIWLCVFSFLTTIGTLAVLILYIFGII